MLEEVPPLIPGLACNLGHCGTDFPEAGFNPCPRAKEGQKTVKKGQGVLFVARVSLENHRP